MVQGIETLTMAMESNIIPDQEYLLQGSILDSHVEALAHRLRGLCDNVGSGTDEQQFSEREMVFAIRTQGGNQQQQSLSLRVRKADTFSSSSGQNNFGGGAGDPPWQLRYLGQPEIGNQRATLVRSCYDIACSSNAVEFLTQLGFRLDYEFAAKGLVFRKGRMKVTVSKIFHIKPHPSDPQPQNPPQGPEALEPLTGSHLVELSVLAPSGNDSVAEDMKNFAEQLKPLVFLDKIDPRRPFK